MTDKTKTPFFNMGLITEHAPLKQALDSVWDTLGDIVKPKAGRQTKAREHFDVLMLNIIDSQGETLAVSMNKLTYVTKSKLTKEAYRYNPLSMTAAFPKLLHRLADAGLVDLELGVYSPLEGESKQTELTPSQELMDLLPTALPLGAIKDISESVVLKIDKTTTIDYEETLATERWRDNLMRFNDALSETHLWVRDADDPTQGRLLSGTATHYRIFNRGSFDCGGRLYSSRLQSLSKADRKRLYIDGERTIEPDFKGMHIAIAYALEGLDSIGDPYAFYKDIPEHVTDTRSVTRGDAKALALLAINAKGRQGAAQALLDEIPEGLSNKTRRALWDAMLSQHSAIAHYFGSDSGIRFQKHDSDIMLLVLSSLLDKGIVAVPVHDSLVVAQKHEQTAIKIMKQAAEAVLAEAGYRVRLAVEQNDLTYDMLIANGLTEDLRDWFAEDETVRTTLGIQHPTAIDKTLKKPIGIPRVSKG